MAAHRSRAESIALWTQLLLVLSNAVTLAQSAVSDGASWVFFLPLVCVLPSVAAFRDIRAGTWGVLSGAALCFVALLWAERSGPASLPDWIVEALGLTWPLFVAAGVLLVAFRIRMHREQEASLLHRHAHGNRAELEASEACGCLACERIYFPSEVQHWLSKSTGETAVCPYCGTDAVVGSASGIPITPGVLARAHARWFLDGADEIVQ